MPSACSLQGLGREDLPHVIQLYTDPAVRAFLGGPVSRQTAEAKAEMLFRARDPFPAWAIRRTRDGVFLGLISLDQHHDGQDTEVSYALLPPYQGHGYATGALKTVCQHAFRTLKLPRLVAETQVMNVASTRLLERVGMFPERKLIRFGAAQVIHIVTAEAWALGQTHQATGQFSPSPLP